MFVAHALISDGAPIEFLDPYGPVPCGGDLGIELTHLITRDQLGPILLDLESALDLFGNVRV